MFATYFYAITGLWVIFVTLFIQNIIAAGAHGKNDSAVPGKMSDSLSHESFEFRSHRTFHNSLENIPTFAVPAILAMMLSVSPFQLAIIVWTYAIARILHMALYYAISTEKNPSPRSYFFLIGVLANIALFIVTGLKFF